MSASGWLAIFRAIAAEVRSEVLPLAGSGKGREMLGRGAGGDQTIYLDALAEEIAIRHLERAYRSGFRFRLLSEEAGPRDFGGSELVLLDPLDGSLNAKYGVPYYAIVLAVTESDQIHGVRLGFVHNLVSGEEFHAVCGAGAFRGGVRLAAAAPVPSGDPPFAVLQLDAPAPVAAFERARPLIERARRLRILGSAGLNLCYAATGGISLQVASLPVRAFDLAGPLLILREAGGIATDLEGRPLGGLSCSLQTRTTLLASVFPELHARALRLLKAQA